MSKKEIPSVIKMAEDSRKDLYERTMKKLEDTPYVYKGRFVNSQGHFHTALALSMLELMKAYNRADSSNMKMLEERTGLWYEDFSNAYNYAPSEFAGHYLAGVFVLKWDELQEKIKEE